MSAERPIPWANCPMGVVRVVLVPGFEPGSPPRKGGMMDRTTPHEP